MSIRSINAYFYCDQCGSTIETEIPADYNLTNHKTMMDLAEEHLKSDFCEVTESSQHICRDCSALNDYIDEIEKISIEEGEGSIREINPLYWKDHFDNRISANDAFAIYLYSSADMPETPEYGEDFHYSGY